MPTKHNTLRTVLSLRNTININEILYGIRHIPIIGKYISERIYGIRILKILALILSIIGEVFKAFAGKLILFVSLFFISGAISSVNDCPQRTIFLYLLNIVMLSSAFIYNLFRPTTESEYGVLLMGMDAKKYIHALFWYNALNIAIGYALFGVPAAILAGVPWYLAIMIPVSGVGFKAFTLGLQMSAYAAKQSMGKRYNRKGIPYSFEGNSNVRILFFCFVIICGPIATIAVAYFNLYLPNVILLTAFSIALLPGLLLIRVFPYGLYRTAIAAEHKRSEITKKDYRKKQEKSREVKINNAKPVQPLQENSGSRAKGFKFLNNLFIKRHSNILWGRLIGTIIGTAAVITLLSVFLYYEVKELGSDAVAESVLRYVFSRHPGVFTLIMLMINSGAYISHAMFANCDSSMLMYGFYKKPESLIKMYHLRFGSIVRFNLIPALMASAFAVTVMVITGGEDYNGQYICTVLCILSSMIFFSVRHLTLYYLLQPYASDFRIKSKLYGLLSFFLYTACIVFVFAPVPAYVLTGLSLIMIFVYSFVGSKLIYQYGPKTFKVK